MENFNVELRNIWKSFGGITALEDVTLEVKKGEIHALLGENGAGKSTLMKVLSGAHQRDKGQIRMDGEEVQIRDTAESKQLGIGIIYQEFSLIPELSVSENIFIAHLHGNRRWIKWRDLNVKAKKLIEELGFKIDPGKKIKNLSIAEQQVVEIAKALAVEVKVLILDEPSAVLGPREIEKLFEILKKLKAKGVSIIYISHRLEEIFQIGDRVTVLKNGKSIGTVEVSETDTNQIIQMMLGRPLASLFPVREVELGNEILNVNNLAFEDKVFDFSVSLREGEVLGIAGLVGSGRTETLQAIFSSKKKNKGVVKLKGKEIHPKSPHQSVSLGIGMVPEDRKSHGLITALPIRDNISLTNYRPVTNRFGFIKKQKEEERVSTLIDKLGIKTSSPLQRANALSGGNQQKVVIAKWINRDCKVLLIDEPTRGVDVGAKVEIYNQINRMAEQGLGLIVVSSEINELLGICDRILVMHEGRAQGILEKENFSEENVLRLMLGSKSRKRH